MLVNLDDDYIKFIRLGQYYIERNGEGILAYISNNSFIDGITHRQMRKSLLETFDRIYVLNLHGNSRKKETAPDGSKDENVFDIMQGVSINFFVKRGRAGTSVGSDHRADRGALGDRPLPCEVYYSDLWGTRESKYAALDAAQFDTVKWQKLELKEPYCFFVPKDFGSEEEYEQGFNIAQLMPECNMGIVTDRDSLFVDSARDEVAKRCRILLSGNIPEAFRVKYRVCDSSSYKLTEKLVGKQFDENYIKPLASHRMQRPSRNG